jgi:flagellar basal body-associated protein FliL
VEEDKMAVKKKKSNIFLIVVLVISIVAVIVIAYIKLNPSDKNISTSNPIEKESQETH